MEGVGYLGDDRGGGECPLADWLTDVRYLALASKCVEQLEPFIGELIEKKKK